MKPSSRRTSVTPNPKAGEIVPPHFVGPVSEPEQYASRLNLATDAGMRFDEETGTVRSCFMSVPEVQPVNSGLSISGAADEFLSANRDLFQLDNISLVVAGEKEGSSQTTCRYEQYQNNIPVYGAFIKVTLRQTGLAVVSAVNNLDYGIPADVTEASVRISPDDAIEVLHHRFDKEFRSITHTRPKLYLYNRNPAWRIDMDTDGPKSYRELWIDAVDGRFIEILDRRRFYVSCPAKIFRPDPVTSSGNPLLNWDSPESALDGELVDVVLENLNDPVQSIFYLNGKWIRIGDMENPEMSIPATGTAFNYKSKDRRLLSVMAYYYLDRLVEWLRSLGIPAFNESMTGPVDVDAQAVSGEDNSHFVVPITGPPYISFGEGGTPDASDPGVIVHEFGHALHYFLLGRLIPPGPFEEGFNDFLSCVFRDRFNDHGFDRANPFPWDNNKTVSWDPIRRCDVNLRFDDPDYGSYGIYKRGTIYATALWDIYLEMGGESQNAGDRLKAAGEFTAIYLDMLIAAGDSIWVIDLANGLIISDKGRTGGIHGEIIRTAFIRRGLKFNFI